MTYACEAGHITESDDGLPVISCPYRIAQRMSCGRMAHLTTSRQGSRQTSARAIQRQMTLGEQYQEKEKQSR